MKFMLMGFEINGEWERLPQVERDRRVARHNETLQALIAQRGLSGGDSLVLTSVGLGPASEATTLRVSDGRPLTVDGPFAETREVLAGFDLIDFASRAEAEEFAKRRCTHDGHVTEARPVREMWWAHHAAAPSGGGMRFMLMILTDERAVAQRSQAEIDRIVQHHQQVGLEYNSQKGLVRGESLSWCSARLQPSREATTLRMSEGRWLASDGPYVETKEVLGGFVLLDCASKPEAVEWARRLAAGGGETIEVRPVYSMWWIYHG